ARTQRNDVHRRVLRRFCVCSTFHQNRCSGKPRALAFDRAGIRDNARGLAYDRTVGEWMPTFSRTRRARRRRGGRATMMKARTFVLVSLACGIASVAAAQDAVQLKFSRVVDLTLPIEINMPGIPGLNDYAENPSRVGVISAISEAQKELLRVEGLTLSNNLAVNGRSMISVLS